jgi:MFS family permease
MFSKTASNWNTFKYRDYRILWVILMTGGVASWLRILGFSQWLLDETGSPFLVGLIGIVQLVVQLPSTLWAGTLADRTDRKMILAAAHGITFIVLAFVATFNSTTSLTPGPIYLAIAIASGAQTLGSPSRAALIPGIFPEKEIMAAASTDTASQNLAAIIGPLLFAFVAVNWGLTEVFFTCAILCLPGFLGPFLLAVSGRTDEKSELPKSQITETLEGLNYVRKHPILPGLFLLDAAITTASFYREILPVIALGLFAAGASGTGFLGSANSAGAIIGGIAVLALTRIQAKGLIVLWASLAYGLFLLAFGLTNSLITGMILIALLGAADSVTVAVRVTTVMLTTPDKMRGRAFSLMYVAAQTSNNIGTIWVGFWAGLIGASSTMIMGGIISIAMTLLILLLWEPIRKYRSND